ncbi:MAG: hypothetical protein N3A58_06215 [Spirochaetes bacterium]|nr:hypothetical protein [Spirochaetota bacterium]
MNNGEELSLIDVFKILWKYKKFIIVFTIIITIIGGVFIFIKSLNNYKFILNKSKKLRYYIYTIEYNGDFNYEVFQNIKNMLKFHLNKNIILFNNIKNNDIFPSDLSNEYINNPSSYPVYKIKFCFNKENKFENEEKIRFINLTKNIIFYSLFKDKIINPFSFQSYNLNYITNLEKVNNYGNAEDLFINSINLINFLENYFENENNIIISYEENYNKILSSLTEIIIVNYQKYNIFYKKIIENINYKINNYKSIDKEEEEEIKFDLKSFLIKIFILTVFSFFISIFFVFLIDFFKKHWNKIKE